MRYRHEYKYRIDARQEAILRVRAAGILQPDVHTDEAGAYIVRSAYFDDAFDTCLNDNLLGAEPRSKLRLRYYGNDTDMIRLEKKTKRNGMACKQSCLLTRREAECYLAGGYPDAGPDAAIEKLQLVAVVLRRGMTPISIVTYERLPFVYSGGNVRITFDRNLSSSGDVGRFLTRDYLTRPVFPAGQSILEIKWDELLPAFIKEALQVEDLQWTAFSKYYMCRAVHL